MKTKSQFAGELVIQFAHVHFQQASQVSRLRRLQFGIFRNGPDGLDRRRHGDDFSVPIQDAATGRHFDDTGIA